MYKLFFLEHTELELHIIAVVFNQARNLDSCTCKLTPCLASYLCQSKFKHSDNTATRKTFTAVRGEKKQVTKVTISNHASKEMSVVKTSFGLTMLLDLDNHN